MFGVYENCDEIYDSVYDYVDSWFNSDKKEENKKEKDRFIINPRFPEDDLPF